MEKKYRIRKEAGKVQGTWSLTFAVLHKPDLTRFGNLGASLGERRLRQIELNDHRFFNRFWITFAKNAESNNRYPSTIRHRRSIFWEIRLVQLIQNRLKTAICTHGAHIVHLCGKIEDAITTMGSNLQINAT